MHLQVVPLCSCVRKVQAWHSPSSRMQSQGDSLNGPGKKRCLHASDLNVENRNYEPVCWSCVVVSVSMYS